jgi:hypothetical protein
VARRVVRYRPRRSDDTGLQPQPVQGEEAVMNCPTGLSSWSGSPTA